MMLMLMLMVIWVTIVAVVAYNVGWIAAYNRCAAALQESMDILVNVQRAIRHMTVGGIDCRIVGTDKNYWVGDKPYEDKNEARKEVCRQLGIEWDHIEHMFGDSI